MEGDPDHFRLGRRPALDGIRAMAILMVMAVHTVGVFWPGSHFNGGLIGVDVFFALSGFLITSLLVEEYDRTGQIRFIPFYKRRAARLLPALFVLLVVVSLCYRGSALGYLP